MISHHIVPFDGETLLDACLNTDEQVTVFRDENGVFVSGKDCSFLIVEDVPGGCLVRHDTKKGFPEFLKIMGAFPAERKRDCWKAISADDRQAWGRHLINFNAQKIRFTTISRKAA